LNRAVEEHRVEIVAGSVEDIGELLGTPAEFPRDAEIPLGDGMVLRPQRVSRSSGFDGTQYLLEGVMSVVTSTSSGVLTAWLLSRLKGKRGVTAIVDGEEVAAGPE
jgi:hypothetical protein